MIYLLNFIIDFYNRILNTLGSVLLLFNKSLTISTFSFSTAKYNAVLLIKIIKFHVIFVL